MLEKVIEIMRTNLSRTYFSKIVVLPAMYCLSWDYELTTAIAQRKSIILTYHTGHTDVNFLFFYWAESHYTIYIIDDKNHLAREELLLSLKKRFMTHIPYTTNDVHHQENDRLVIVYECQHKSISSNMQSSILNIMSLNSIISKQPSAHSLKSQLISLMYKLSDPIKTDNIPSENNLILYSLDIKELFRFDMQDLYNRLEKNKIKLINCYDFFLELSTTDTDFSIELKLFPSAQHYHLLKFTNINENAFLRRKLGAEALQKDSCTIRNRRYNNQSEHNCRIKLEKFSDNSIKLSSPLIIKDLNLTLESMLNFLEKLLYAQLGFYNFIEDDVIISSFFKQTLRYMTAEYLFHQLTLFNKYSLYLYSEGYPYRIVRKTSDLLFLLQNKQHAIFLDNNSRFKFKLFIFEYENTYTLVSLENAHAENLNKNIKDKMPTLNLQIKQLIPSDNSFYAREEPWHTFNVFLRILIEIDSEKSINPRSIGYIDFLLLAQKNENIAKSYSPFKKETALLAFKNILSGSSSLLGKRKRVQQNTLSTSYSVSQCYPTLDFISYRNLDVIFSNERKNGNLEFRIACDGLIDKTSAMLAIIASTNEDIIVRRDKKYHSIIRQNSHTKQDVFEAKFCVDRNSNNFNVIIIRTINTPSLSCRDKWLLFKLLEITKAYKLFFDERISLADRRRYLSIEPERLSDSPFLQQIENYILKLPVSSAKEIYRYSNMPILFGTENLNLIPQYQVDNLEALPSNTVLAMRITLTFNRTAYCLGTFLENTDGSFSFEVNFAEHTDSCGTFHHNFSYAAHLGNPMTKSRINNTFFPEQPSNETIKPQKEEDNGIELFFTQAPKVNGRIPNRFCLNLVKSANDKLKLRYLIRIINIFEAHTLHKDSLYDELTHDYHPIRYHISLLYQALYRAGLQNFLSQETEQTFLMPDLRIRSRQKSARSVVQR